jgi:hypothetical protein
LDNSLGANQFVGRRGDTGWDVPEAIIVGGRGTTASGNAGGGNGRRHHQRASQPRRLREHPPQRFHHRPLRDNPAQTEYGFITQDVQPLFPNLVLAGKDSLRRLSLNYVGLIAPIVKAMQQPKADIANLRDEVEADPRPEERSWLPPNGGADV